MDSLLGFPFFDTKWTMYKYWHFSNLTKNATVIVWVWFAIKYQMNLANIIQDYFIFGNHVVCTTFMNEYKLIFFALCLMILSSVCVCLWLWALQSRYHLSNPKSNTFVSRPSKCVIYLFVRLSLSAHVNCHYSLSISASIYLCLCVYLYA